ncbi:MAG: hypothetical protein ABIH67_04405 [Candidatus Uhrbacteria bacterium]
MKKIILHILAIAIIVAVTVLVVVGLENAEDTTAGLPEVAPAETVLTYSYDQGFNGYYYQYTISRTELKVVTQDDTGDEYTETTYELDPGVLEYLYDVMALYQFSDIDIIEDFAADMGGTSIVLDLGGGTTIDKTATGGSYVDPEDLAEFDLIASEIETFVAEYHQ